jgi:hypothetical protein
MENNRQLRFLIPPFVLIVSLAFGAALDEKSYLRNAFASSMMPSDAPATLKPAQPAIDSTSKLIGLLAAGGIFIVTFGFLVSTCQRRAKIRQFRRLKIRQIDEGTSLSSS